MTLDLTGSSSPTGNTPLTFLTMSGNQSAAVLGANLVASDRTTGATRRGLLLYGDRDG